MTTIQFHPHPAGVTTHVPRWFTTTVVGVAVGTNLVALGRDGRAEGAIDGIASGISWLAAAASGGAVLLMVVLMVLIVAGVAGAGAAHGSRLALGRPVAAAVQPQPADPEAPCGCHPDFHELGCHEPPSQPDE